MSRPPISYPTPQSSAPAPGGGPRPSLEPSPFRRDSDVRVVSGPRGSTTALDSSITRLLVVTKQLLQGLEQWAQGKLSEDDVSDIYVRLGNGFELCVSAFRRVGISTTDLDSVPQDLREVLEKGLAEEPSQETLNVYLPEIRSIIYNLLSGLKTKQLAYKRTVTERGGPVSTGQSPTPSDPYTQPVTLSRSRRESSVASGSGSISGPSGSNGVAALGVGAGSISLSPEVERARLGSESRSSDRESSTSPGSSSSQLPPTGSRGQPPPSIALAERTANRQGSGSTSTRPAPPDAFRPSRPRPSDASRRAESPLPPVPTSAGSTASGSDTSSIVRHQLHDGPVPLAFPVPVPGGSSTPISAASTSSAAAPPRPPQRTPPHPDRRFSRDSFGNPRAQSRFSADSDITNGSPIATSASHSPAQNITTLSEVPEQAAADSIAPSIPTLPILKLPSDISLADTVTPRDADADAEQDLQPPSADDFAGSRSTLAALQRSDALERRASKRFSSYTFNKMLPGSPNSGKKGSVSNGSPQRPMRRGENKMPPMPPVPESIATLVITPSDEEGDAGSGRSSREGSVIREGSPAHAAIKLSSPNLHPIGLGLSETSGGIPARARTPDQERNGDISDEVTPRASGPSTSTDRITPSTSASSAALNALAAGEAPGVQSQAAAAPPFPPTSVKVFLQLGRQVKKAIIDLPVTMAALRLLFMERFEYDPGLEDFPDVYLRDSRTGVQYELEDMDDLREDCVLTLDIEPLDQVKQHFDTTFASLAQEVKELKAAFQSQPRRHSITPASSLLAVSPSTHKVGGGISERSPEGAAPRPSTPSPMTPTPSTGPNTAILGSSSGTGAGRETELRAQYDEVQNLRRDLAIMRQFHVDFLAETKASFTALRSQNSAMRDVVKTKMGGSRALLDNSKSKLEAQCQDTIQAVEEISDTIDGAREDALRRGITPSRTTMSRIHADLKAATEQVDVFSKDVTLADPTWRATWAAELNRVMEEQRLLAYQVKLATDLKNDIKDATEMLANVQAFVDQRAASGGGGSARKAFRPAEEDGPGGEGGAGGGITNLLMEIRTKEADPTSRLRAIEQQQKARERELASRTDEFASELSGFVVGKKLKKTGGTEEAERIRQRRHDMTVKRMLSDGGVGAGGAGGGGGGASPPGVLSPQGTGGSGLLPASPGESVTSKGSIQGDK